MATRNTGLTRSEEIELSILKWMATDQGVVRERQAAGMAELASLLGVEEIRMVDYALRRLQEAGVIRIAKYVGDVRHEFSAYPASAMFQGTFNVMALGGTQYHLESLTRRQTDVNSPREATEGLVFISCGQSSQDEIELGLAVERMINERLAPIRGYFARNQSSLEGLTEQILRTLDQSVGFIAIMHERGKVKTLDKEIVRGSVWVEQEIAIAAFLRQAHKKSIQTLAYVRKGIEIEGLRLFTMLNPVPFDTKDDVLSDLTERLRSGRFTVESRTRDVDLRPIIDHRELSITSGYLHRYELVIHLANEGKKSSDYLAEIEFPAAFIDQAGVISGEIQERATSTHRFFRMKSSVQGGRLEQGDKRKILQLNYRMDEELEGLANWRELDVIVTLKADHMAVKTVRRSMLELTNY